MEQQDTKVVVMNNNQCIYTTLKMIAFMFKTLDDVSIHSMFLYMIT